jgi:hypothetical protein
MRKTELIGGMLAGIILLSGCSSATPQATLTLTATSTTTSTPTITPSPMPTVTVDLYTYSKEKLFNPIPSYDYFIANPEKVAWSPYDPWTQPEEFKKWLNGDLVTALGGDLTKLEPNVTMNASFPFSMDGGINVENFVVDKARATPFRGQSIIFGVKHDGVEYPVVVTMIGDVKKDSTLGVHAVLLFDGPVLETMQREGTGCLSLINDRNLAVGGIGMFRSTDVSSSYPKDISTLLALGFDAFSNGYAERDKKNIIGFGPGYFEFYK